MDVVEGLMQRTLRILVILFLVKRSEIVLSTFSNSGMKVVKFDVQEFAISLVFLVLFLQDSR